MKNVLEYLENSAILYPNKPAAEDGDEEISYTELMMKSMRVGSAVADTLTRQTKEAVNSGNDEKQRPIVIFADKSILTLVSIMGVVYSGNFYVNISTEQPQERIKSILENLKPAAVIVSRNDYKYIDSFSDVKIIIMEDAVRCEINEDKLRRIREESSEKDILYCIFTSGSTGKPKGIITSHEAVIKVIDCFIDIFEITSEDRFANQAPFDFDVSVKDIYSSLASGATIILIEKKYFSAIAMLMEYLCQKKVTTLIWAVSALCILSSMRGLEYKVPYSINKVMLSGEVMPQKELSRWRRALPNAVFVNLYGPTEITCHCTYHIIENEFTKIPIGKAFPGRRVFLVDDDMKLIETPDKIGEIMVAGDSLSYGYYNSPVLTDKSFIQYSIDGKKAERVYKTGDLGFYGEDENLYFAGRKDFQIKNMGHRIELEDIEAAINSLRGVTRCCCTFNREKKQLRAFYMGDGEPEDIYKALKKLLPGYMIPRKISKVDEIPLSRNGKLDRMYFQNM